MSAAAAIAVPILLEVARKVGAPLIERVLGDRLGQAAGGVAGQTADAVIDAIARKAGVPADQLADQPRAELETAVKAAEPETAEIVLAHVESQREANRLQLAEMGGSTWSWSWRPATMWLIAGLWLWSLALVPVVNAAIGAAVPVYLDKLVWLTTTYLALYMGGHTIKQGIREWKARGRRDT